MIALVLSDEEAAFLKKVLENWTEGCRESVSLTADDPSIVELETLMDLTEGLQDEIATAEAIYERLM